MVTPSSMVGSSLPPFPSLNRLHSLRLSHFLFVTSMETCPNLRVGSQLRSGTCVCVIHKSPFLQIKLCPVKRTLISHSLLECTNVKVFRQSLNNWIIKMLVIHTCIRKKHINPVCLEIILRGYKIEKCCVEVCWNLIVFRSLILHSGD